MVESEIRPLAPASADHASGDEEGKRKTHGGRRRCYICCGCCTAIVFILGLLILILALTVFKVKDPEISMNSVQLDGLNVNIGNSLSSLISLNMTLTTDISVKNPNAASFNFGNATTVISFRGETIGEAKSPAGKARARRTFRMNVTTDVMIDRLVTDPTMITNIVSGSGSLIIGTYTELRGKVNLLNIFKHHAKVKMSCNITISISNRAIEEQRCHRSVKL